MNEKKKYTGWFGTVSLVLLFTLIASYFIPAIIWDHVQGPDDVGMRVVLGFTMVLVLFPLMIMVSIATIITGIVAIKKKSGRKQGIVAVSVMTLIYVIEIIRYAIASY